jgi:hypothetical protein
MATCEECEESDHVFSIGMNADDIYVGIDGVVIPANNRMMARGANFNIIFL